MEIGASEGLESIGQTGFLEAIVADGMESEVGVEWEDIKQVVEEMPCIIVCGEGKNDLQEVTCTEYSSSRVILGTLWRSDEIECVAANEKHFSRGMDF